MSAITTSAPRTWLRRWLALDAAVTTANALAYLLAAGPVGRLLGVDGGLLAALGAFLLLYGAAVGWLARSPEPRPVAVNCVVEANIAWTVASFAALALWLDPSTAGTVWIPAQAAVVAALAAAQYATLRAARTATATATATA
ncbi:hypothetical protein [Streptomyces sp. 6N223]|uniref:hypothetical protein n=1 Tax=Streptomyces sp. 6N223 TaxID=3457412 RepID=UPI003FCFE7F8